MPCITQDPNTAEPPDFDSQEFRETCTPLATLERTVDIIIADLKAAWTHLNNAKKLDWQRQLEADQEVELEAQRVQEEEELAAAIEKTQQEETDRRKKEKKKPKLKNITANKTVGNIVIPRPSSYALNKLRDFEYVELHYFSVEGCAEAAKHDHTVAKDTFSLTSSDDRLLLKPTVALRPSSKNNMLHHMSKEGWPDQHVLNGHRLRQQIDGDAVLIIYQAQVRREWHETLKATDDTEAFDISVINDIRIDALHTSLLNSHQAQAVMRCVDLSSLFIFSTHY
ncbi:hypothetical protein BYT27DRAFT_7324376 [Phlegmacium glaucopus]|nr:hypothetical protein BYT27DRAFT_7324376 [Phlegmacium glaucopus]